MPSLLDSNLSEIIKIKTPQSPDCEDTHTNCVFCRLLNIAVEKLYLNIIHQRCYEEKEPSQVFSINESITSLDSLENLLSKCANILSLQRCSCWTHSLTISKRKFPLCIHIPPCVCPVHMADVKDFQGFPNQGKQSPTVSTHPTARSSDGLARFDRWGEAEYISRGLKDTHFRLLKENCDHSILYDSIWHYDILIYLVQ